MRAIRSAAVVLIAAFFTVTYAASGWCQAYPNRTIQLIIAYAAGGTGDIVARSVSDKLGAALGQTVVVENRAGASGSIGAHSVTTAAPDGYTLLVGQTGEIAVNQHWLKGLNYDPDNDLVPIALAAVVPLALVVPSKAPYSTLPDFLTALKAKPKITFASAGIGTPGHFAGELLKLRLNAYMVHIPYRGGDVPLIVVSIPAAMSQVRSGRLRPLAVTTQKRTSILPDVPTVAEATGLRDFEVDSWYAMFAPAKAPDEAVAVMNKAIATAVALPEVKAKLLEQGAEGMSSTPERLGATVTREIAQWRELVKHTRIEGE